MSAVAYLPTPVSAYTRVRRAIWAERSTRYTPWSESDDRVALDMRGRGKSYGQIACRVCRTPDAVAARLRYLNERGRA